ncbi:unnamed protein product [Effrenium voratum]|uniref:Uncharacterized protein n=1 Tax=Effrenium voratum TaxID=2562239 RepID=A0AA36NB87_9DINO|nr:unnamed protein product [Effrenium voratum]
MAMFTVSPCTLEHWFQEVPLLLSDQGWDLTARAGAHSLHHATCPWGGRLLKVKAGSVPSEGIVRPEVLADVTVERLAPGAAVVLEKDWSHLFGLRELTQHEEKVKAVTQRLRRDFPEEGDCAVTFVGESCGLLFSRPDGDGFELTCVFQVSEEQFAQWSSIQKMLLLDSSCRFARNFATRSEPELREKDRDYYMVLTVQSCRRGLPLVPSAESEEPTVTITAGISVGLERWTRFSPNMASSGSGSSDGRFCVADFVGTFAARLGLSLAAYDSMDGQRLVPYQCVVARQEWEAAKDRFVNAFLLQKKAYRRANGGSSAPSFHVDVQPRAAPDGHLAELKQRLRQEERPSHKVVVRRTFLEVEEEEDEISMAPAQRQVRRPKTTGIVAEASVLAF